MLDVGIKIPAALGKGNPWIPSTPKGCELCCHASACGCLSLRRGCSMNHCLLIKRPLSRCDSHIRISGHQQWVDDQILQTWILKQDAYTAALKHQDNYPFHLIEDFVSFVAFQLGNAEGFWSTLPLLLKKTLGRIAKCWHPAPKCFFLLHCFIYCFSLC